MSNLPPSKIQGVKDSDVCHSLQFAGLPEKALRANVVSELERLVRAIKEAERQDEIDLSLALAVRLEMLSYSYLERLRSHHPKADMDWHRELVASLETDDLLVDNDSARERQIEHLAKIGIKGFHIVRIKEPRTGSNQMLFVSKGRQSDFQGNVYEDLEQLPSFYRTVPRISRSLSG